MPGVLLGTATTDLSADGGSAEVGIFKPGSKEVVVTSGLVSGSLAGWMVRGALEIVSKMAAWSRLGLTYTCTVTADLRLRPGNWTDRK